MFGITLLCWAAQCVRKLWLEAGEQDVDVLYLSRSYLVVNKAPDLRINSDHPQDKSSLHYKLYRKYPSLANTSLKHYFYFVHRLDYSTSGLICIALNKQACAQASTAFQKRAAKKYYLAILRGHVSQTHLDISHAIGELLEENECAKMGSERGSAVLANLKKATTKLVVLQRGLFARYPATKVVLMPETGRRHQLRVHCSSIGHTIVGDYTYSNRKDTEPQRMYLHSYRLEIPCKCELLEVESLDPFQPADQRTGWYPVEHLNHLNKLTLDNMAKQAYLPT